MACAAAAVASGVAASPAALARSSVASSTSSRPLSMSFCGLAKSFAARLPPVAAAKAASLAGAPSASQQPGVVVATADNVEQQKQQEQQVVEDAVQDTIRNLEESKPQKPLSSRQGLEERFAVLNTGVYECRSCGHVYEESKGDRTYPVAAGTSFRDLPEDWLCPTCGAARTYYQTKSVEVAGFAQNQQYGLGGNTLTGSQKSLLIYGSLLFFFALFLSGYFLQ